MRAIVLAMALVSTPTLAAEQFDLVCTSKKDTVRYRVDLAKGEWCVGPCETVLKIASVTSGTITLVDREPQFASDDRDLNQIDRATGAWTDISYGGRTSPWERKGACKVAEYSGMPAPKF
jgi:hypothetical protein